MTLTVMKLNLSLLCAWLVALDSSTGQDFYFSVNGVKSYNHSLTRMENIGIDAAALYCVTPHRPCCKSTGAGEWYFPDGTLVPVRAAGGDFYRNRDNNGGVLLHRRNNAVLPNGKYRCVIPESASSNKLIEMIVGIYSDLAYPTIYSQPTSVLNAVPGSQVTFSLRARQATRYRWVYNGDLYLQDNSKYQGVNTNTLVISNVQELDEGQYHCVVEKELSVSSESVSLTVLDPPVIDQQPVGVPYLILGQDVTFAVQASGVDLSYQWQYANGSPLEDRPNYDGKDTPTFTIHEVTREEGGSSYRCAVRNLAGTVYSSVVNITLLEPPQIVEQPEDMFDLLLGQSVTFTLQAIGYNLTYRWEYANHSPLSPGTDFDGVDTPTLVIKSVGLEHEREYHCAVSNAAGTVYSDSVNISIIPVPPVSSLNATPDITSVLLTWTSTLSQNGPLTFQVSYHHVSIPESEVSVEVEGLSFTADGLLPKGHYQFEVRQVTELGVGGAEIVRVKLNKNIPAVEGVNMTVVNSSAVFVSWDPLSSLPGWNVSFYEVHSYTTLTNHTSSRPLHTLTARTTSGGQSSIMLVHGDLLSDSEGVELVIEVSSVLDVGVEGVGTLRGEPAVQRMTLALETVVFQLILGPTDYCINWSDERTAAIRGDIKAALAQVISNYCHCTFSPDSIDPGAFSCRQSSNTVTYRSSVSGVSAEQIVSLIERWVREGSASLLVRSFFWNIRNTQDCAVRISSMNDAECINEQGSTPRTLLTSDPAVINCVSRCVAESGLREICETNP